MRDRILEAAVGLLRDSGVKKLAQTQVAKAARVPQGHLTYYFPKKADMLMAVAERFLAMLAADAPEESADRSRTSAYALDVTKRLIRDVTRTRMLLGLLVEADRDDDLRAAMIRGATFVRASLASAFELPVEGPQADLALAVFWGLGLQQFLFGEQRTPEETAALIEKAAAWIEQIKATDGPPPPVPGSTAEGGKPGVVN